MVSEDKNEMLEKAKGFEEVFFQDERLVLKKNHGHCVFVQDSIKGLRFGEVRYKKGDFYDIREGDKKVTLLYSNLEKIFVNNKKELSNCT